MVIILTDFNTGRYTDRYTGIFHINTDTGTGTGLGDRYPTLRKRVFLGLSVKMAFPAKIMNRKTAFTIPEFQSKNQGKTRISQIP